MSPFPSDNTAMPNKSFLRSAGSLANAFPMALRSLHNDPVGIETSRLTPRKYCGFVFFTSVFFSSSFAVSLRRRTQSTASTGF